MRLTEAVATTLRERFGDRFQTGAAIRDQHGATMTWLAPQPPDAVVFPKTADEVADLVRL